MANRAVAILCGGRGTRLRERTEAIPKALVEIGGRPILWHVISIYAAQGFERFLLCTGYKGEQIEQWVTEAPWPDGIDVSCVDTGLDTPTGGRIKLLEDRLEGEPFCATYADGVADIDLAALVRAHNEGGALATVTVVRPTLQFGVADLADDGEVRGFQEKPGSTAGSTAASSASSRERWSTSRPTAFSSANRSSVWPPTGSCGPTGTGASGTAWTPTRTR